MRVKFIRGLSLILILSLVAIIFSSSSKISAQCATGSQIEVDNGLISASTLAPFKAGTNVSCIGSDRAVIPQFSILSYDEMKKLYFDQVQSSFSKTTLSGNQTQTTTSKPINLIDF